MTRQGGLGRGLSALIPAAEPGRSGLVHVALDRLEANPHQPREGFDDSGLHELAHSLREFGMLQPIVARPLDGSRFQIVAGERRFRAARLAGLETVPVVVRHTADSQMLTEALVENLHRADLDPIEEALAYQQLIDDFGMTHEDLATRLGRSRSTISNALRLLGLPTEVQGLVGAGQLSAGHARAVLGLADQQQRRRVAQRIVAEGLSVRQAEELVRALQDQSATTAGEAAGGLAKEAQARRSPFVHLQDVLEEALATKVRIRGSMRRGRVVIEYAGREDLERLLDILARGSGTDLDQ